MSLYRSLPKVAVRPSSPYWRLPPRSSRQWAAALKFIGASYSALQTKIVLEYLGRCGLKSLSMEPLDVPFTQVGQVSVETVYAHAQMAIARASRR